MTRPGDRLRGWLLGVLLLVAVGPLLLLVIGSLGRDWFYPSLLPTQWTLDAWRALLRGSLASATVTGLALAFGTGVLAVALALPTGRALARLRGWRRSLGAGLVFLPVAAPPIALATGLQYSFLAIGLGGSVWGVLVAHLIPATGYVSLYFLGIFSQYDFGLEDAARSLGATPLQVLRRIGLPLLHRPLAEGVALGFLISWAQVPLTLLIGGGHVRTVALEIFAYIGAGQEQFAAAGALLLIGPALAALLGARLAVRGSAAPV